MWTHEHLPLLGFRAVALGLATAIVALAARAEDAPPPKKRAEITILHTNDWHGNALPEKPANAKREAGMQGGAVACAAAIARIRAERPGAVLALDGGDLLGGHPAASFVEDGVTGAGFIRAWSLVGFDAWVVGNHDLDAGVENLRRVIALAKPVALAANFVKEDGSGPVVPALPHRTFEVGGIRVAVIGLTTGDLPRLLPAATLAGTKTIPPVEAARPLVAKLRPEADLLVALTHLGVDDDRVLAKAVPELDAIVGGHSHTRLRTPVIEGKTIIVQAGAHGRELGRLDLTVEGGKVAAHDYRLLPLPVEESGAPAELVAEVKKLAARLAVLEAEVIGETTEGLRRGNYFAQTEAGSFVADTIRLACAADVGFVNSGGVRAALPQGKVTRANLYEMLPFDDDLATFEATGAELEAICLHNARAAVSRDHGVLQVSGLRYRWRRDESGGAAILSVEVGGKPLDRARTYVCATNRFLLFEQAEKYFGYVPPSRKKRDDSIRSAVEAALKNGPVERPDRGRMWEERGATVPAGSGPEGGKSEQEAGD